MAFLRKKNTQGSGAGTTQPQSTISGQPAAFGTSGAAGQVGVSGGTTAAPTGAAAGRTASTPSYVSGQQYLEGNRAGAQKLATQIVDPLKQQASSIEQAARTRALNVQNKAGANNFNQGYIDKAAADARTLSDIERANVKQTLSGKYGGPTEVDFTGERSQVGNLSDTVNSLGTVGGINERLTDLSGGKKYTTGMRNFDAMLMRQDPSLRTQLEAQKGLGDRVTGTIDTQKQSALDAIAKGQASAGTRGVAANKQLSGVTAGQEGKWKNALTKLQGRAGGINAAITDEKPLSLDELNLLGLTPQEYDKFRDAYIATSYARNRPLTEKENYNYNLSSPFQATALGDNITANYWKNFQLDPFTVDTNKLGYQNVVGQEGLAKYQALNELMGSANADFVPGSASANPEANALYFNKAAANNALNAFMASGAKKPTSNLQYQQGTGTFAISGGGKPGTYVRTGGTDRNPVTGGYDNTKRSYTGPMSTGGYFQAPLKPYDTSLYKYDTSVDSAAVNARNLRSGGMDPLETIKAIGAPTQQQRVMAPAFIPNKAPSAPAPAPVAKPAPAPAPVVPPSVKVQGRGTNIVAPVATGTGKGTNFTPSAGKNFTNVAKPVAKPAPAPVAKPAATPYNWTKTDGTKWTLADGYKFNYISGKLEPNLSGKAAAAPAPVAKPAPVNPVYNPWGWLANLPTTNNKFWSL